MTLLERLGHTVRTPQAVVKATAMELSRQADVDQWSNNRAPIGAATA